MEQGLLDHLRGVVLFQSVDDASLLALGDGVAFATYDAGEVIVREGESSTDLFVVIDGTIEVSVGLDDGSSYVVGKVGPGAVVGEIAMLTGEVRSATAAAVTDAAVVQIREDAFLRLLADNPDLTHAVVDAAAERLKRTQLTSQLVRHLRLEDLDAIAEIEQHVSWRSVPAGAWLFRKGDAADAAFLVATGRLRVVDDGDEVVGEIGRGELVGEMALLEGGVRNAGVYAIRDSQLVEFPASVVALLLDRFPQVFLHLTRTILHRVRRPASVRRPDEQLSIAVVPLTPGSDGHDFARRLSRVLTGFGESTHLWSDRVDELLDKRGIAQSGAHDVGEVRLVQWLHEVEDRSTYLVLEADLEPTSWSQRVVRQSDYVLYYADARGARSPGPLEQAVVASLAERTHPRSSLVLAQPPGTTLPSGTARWLADRDVSNVFHLRDGETRDIERIARMLAGRAVSVVLSGGGARGYAHIGVLQAMNELEIPIDYIAGTSIGSVMASLAPLGRSHDEMLEQVHKSFDNIMDWTLPVASVIRGKRITDAIVEQTSGIDIEDLWFPYFCISASLTRARAVVHRRGPLATAMRASVAIPGVLPPVPVDGELLVDGGVIDNLPVPEARRDNPTGSLVAVDVAPPSGPRAKFDYGYSMSGWTALRTRLGKKSSAPLLHATVLGSMLIASTRDRDRVVSDGLADLYLPIDARECGPFEWTAVEKISRVGYEVTRDRLAQWIDDSGAPWRRVRV